MKIAIVEDEAVVARRLARMVQEIAEDAQIEVRPDFDSALELLRSKSLDVLLLDLDLGGRDGFRLLEAAAAGPFRTIVVSAHKEEALRAFDYGVADFVAKPFTRERLRLALSRVREQAPPPPGETRYLVVRKGRDTLNLPVARLVYARGADDYSALHLEDASVHLHEKSLSELAAILPPRFRRIHRSYLVDMDRVASLRSGPGGRLDVVLQNGVALPAGRRHRAAIRSARGS
jgi:two-component system, LytTR family, response regulator LytT